KFGSVVEVVDNVRAAGVDQLGLLTEQRKTANTPAPASTAATPTGGQYGSEETFMGMAVGPSGGKSADISVTPLIDVLFGLVIIFMVITQLTPKRLQALLPRHSPPTR